MSVQPRLPLFPTPPVVGRPDPDAAAVRENAGVEYHEIAIRNLLNRCSTTRMPFAWTINPYRGCEFACTYCYARYTHGFLDLHRWQDFEEKIFVKKGAATALERQLRRAALQGQPIAIGTATDPYQPAERHFQITRSLLAVLARVEGLEISITTKSPLIVRDLDLLTDLDRRHSIVVNVSITTTDASLARRLEPRAPTPEARFRTVAKLARQGLTVGVFVMPVLPGLNDKREALLPIFTRAVESGAHDVIAAPLFLRPAARARFLPWLNRELPDLAERYSRIFGRRDYLRAKERDRLMASYRRLRIEFGLPRQRPGRG